VELSELVEIAEKERRARPPRQIRCCTAAGCLSSNSKDVVERLSEAVKTAGLADQVKVAGVGCMRLCSQGPFVQVDPDRALYRRVTPDNAASIVAGIGGGTVTAERGDLASSFFKLQSSVILENSGWIEPERIES
jgi:bidirectional [NiFe] hydrogenase diaphorase subunit